MDFGAPMVDLRTALLNCFCLITTMNELTNRR